MKQVFIASRCSTRVSVVSAIEVLRIWFLLDPALEPEPLTKELELELLGSGSLLESDPPMESALFGVCTSLILIQEAPSVCFHAR